MPKLPRISGRECIAALQRMGFEIVRQKGSHVVMRWGASGCVVPNHPEIRVGYAVRHLEASQCAGGGVH